MVKADGGGFAGGGEVAGLIDEFLGEVEGGEVVVAFVPETEGDAAGAAAGFEKGSGFFREEAFDEEAFRFPETEKMRGAGVVNDRERVIEMGANGFGGDLFHGENARRKK